MNHEHTELIQLHMAMADSFDDAHIQEIGHALLGDVYDRFDGMSKRDKIREMLLVMQRYERVSELANLCQQMQADFNWRDRDIAPLYESTGDRPVDAAQLVSALANRFSLEDLRQLCFYLGIDFERTEYSLWLLEVVNESSDAQRRRFQSIGVDYDTLTAGERDRLLKELWANHFCRLCQEEDIWAQAVAVCRYLHPKVF